MRKTRSTGARHAAAGPRGRTGHRGRRVAIALAVGVSALVVRSLVRTPDEPVRVDSAAYYQFVSVRDGSALDVAGADGFRIRQEKRADAATQQWQLKGLAGGYCRLVNRSSGKVLGRSATSVADVEQQSDTGATAQQWQLTDVGGGAVKIVSRDGGMVLSVTGGTDRHVVVQSADRGTADQRWNLAKAETAATRAAPPAVAAAPIAGGGFVTGAVVADRAGGLPGGRLEAAPGLAGDRGIADRGGLLHATDGGASFSKLGEVGGADAVGFGKAAPGARHPALHLAGTVNSVTGLVRSTDGAAARKRINDDRHRHGGGAGAITGDPDVFGRVCPGSAAARGVLYGDPS
ncbi:RICIN domain-containing protein [Amycolatopsis sp. CA-126428]|uniref:RICIN domain-containing protein n=1 Tax=Amycolatopsis sp. CA-126428 TaxID=2073158 RepID=UPI000CD0DA3D|nr:RICIN domain-containing protein [Amycolatopsis sp. CA-126428]